MFNEKTRKCYKAFHLVKIWTEAENYCKEQGLNGDLASIPNIETQNFMQSFVTSAMIENGLWIGGQKNPSGEWSWSDGNIWSYENWGSGWPRAEEDIKFLRFHPDYEWCDYTEKDKSYFLCQHSI